MISMDQIADHKSDAGERPRELTTATLVLVAIRNAQRPLTTYELGLDICDNHYPPRAISVIVKSLAKDKYLVAAAKRGKRAAEWALTERAYQSLLRRVLIVKMAEEWIRSRSNLTQEEKSVMCAKGKGAKTYPQISAITGLRSSSIRTSLKRDKLRKSLRSGTLTEHLTEG